MKALVTGGTGTLGRLVVPRLQDAGCDVRVLSRRRRESSGEVEFVTGDLASDQGVEVLGSRPGCGLYQAASFVLITFHGARAMDDDLGTLHRILDPLTVGKITSHELDIPAVLAPVPAQYPYVVSGMLQPLNDEPPERARAARNQSFHSCLSLSHLSRAGCHLL